MKSPIRVLLLDHRLLFRKAVAAVLERANGIEPDEFVMMIRSAIAGETSLSPAIATRLVRAIRESTAERARQAAMLPLTAREAEILECVGEGLSNARIAARLSIADGTVKNHVHTLLDKLGLRNRVEAAALVTRARQAGSPNPDPGSPK